MKNSLLGAAMLSCAVISAHVQAATTNFSHSYVSAGVGTYKADGFDDGNSYHGKISAQFSQGIFVAISADRLQFEKNGIDSDLDLYKFEVGAVTAAAKGVDIEGHMGLINTETRTTVLGQRFTESEDGYTLGASTRVAMGEYASFVGGYNLLKFEKNDEYQNHYNVGLIFSGEQHGLQFGYDTIDNDAELSGYNLGYRFTFK